MNDIILAIDEEDTELGSFFKDCGADLINFFEQKQITIDKLVASQINHVYVKVITENLNSFTFLAYSHGSDAQLVSNGTSYIDEDNADSFENSLFYTCSCDTGKLLGSKLVQKGCLSYIGYKDKFIVWDFNRLPFVECANYAIKQIYLGKGSEEALIMAKSKYNEYIDDYNNDLMGAAMLRSNRDVLIHLGEGVKF